VAPTFFGPPCNVISQNSQRDSHEVGPVSVYDGAESQSVFPRRRHVGDADITISVTLQPAPLLQRSHLRSHSHLLTYIHSSVVHVEQSVRCVCVCLWVVYVRLRARILSYISTVFCHVRFLCKSIIRPHRADHTDAAYCYRRRTST